jgi:hypothetical protein
MGPSDCQNCGEQVPLFARVCRYCGAPNPSWRSVMFVVGALAVLLVVGVGAVLFILLGGRGSGGIGAGLDPRGSGDFAPLETAMKQCDAEAEKETKALILLVAPLVDEPKDDPGWRRIQLNEMGNAILINAENMLAGLRRKALLISKDEYTFRIRDEGTKEVFAWKPSVGVRKFVMSDASAIESFSAQFQSSDPARALQWGAAIKRQEGTCYWVNAILRT